ncbi:MAG: preprotein translocase subunit SecA [Clostridiaceae bacterium]|jgi:preprotein translocase subunit SecA|nr:preprotein translocase subunit SecA [Clostridiaceae bacterium]
MSLLTNIFGTHSTKEIKRIIPIVDAIEALDEFYSQMSETELIGTTDKLKGRLSEGETLDDILPDAFAAVREASNRVLGMKPYRVQLIGGIILHQGRIAEMKTGEGKTLVATLPVYLNALTGKGVHIVTVNDYLAKRDSEWMGKIYKYLGLSVGLIVHDKSNDERRVAYASDITYGTNNEYGFDYLRDNMVDRKSKLVQRELNFAIVDEVDSILIDEARTPLIISGMGEESSDMYSRADRFVKGLRKHVVVETDDKVDMDEIVGDCDYVVDEKAKTAVLTSRGVDRAEKYFGIDNLSDSDNFEIMHYINNALKANGTMNRDQKYVVTDGEVIIVDDFTGRLMYGRRFSDGLHQAIEAKEGVKVERESKTLATITFQNYFRMYSKLSGMTGTAYTEEAEFRSIYNLDVIQIPTNMPMVRVDESDTVYKSQIGKQNAVLDVVLDATSRGQPVLVGTVNVDKSELFSRLFTKAGIRHNVLNAKNHMREAEIVAQAGRFGSVTIATNMAGRGTDILLGGNPEYMAKLEMRKIGYSDELIDQATAHNETDDSVITEARTRFSELHKVFKVQTSAESRRVIDAGGLLIVGTERHESRRIDDQLRGRSGRQGDPGRSRFFLALDDDLLRLFGGERANALFNTFGVDDSVEIKSGYLSKQIETAQKKIEGLNFSSRKHVLEYDDVMNVQRNITYAQRKRVLDGEDIHETYIKMIRSSSEKIIQDFALDGTISSTEKLALSLKIKETFGDLEIADQIIGSESDSIDASEIAGVLTEQALARFEQRDETITPEIFREAERQILLYNVDQKWMDHIDAMDQLRYAIGMRSVGQKDPVIEYRLEGSEMFDEMNASIQMDAVRMIMKANIVPDQRISRKTSVRKLQEGHGDDISGPSAQTIQTKASVQSSSTPVAKQPVRRDSTKIGRNDPCYCGSGKKYKNCCGKEQSE